LIACLDTSAVVPLLIGEPTSSACRRLWDAADQVVSTRLLYVEATAALAQATRLDRLTGDDLAGCLTVLDRYWEQIDAIELDDAIMTEAARLAFAEVLRGYDVVHCAAAHLAADPELVAGSGDQHLL
jgi:predicted nucleic acid-binding protein